ncbi:hypothetical protein V8E36_000640 [Tilletia maclaganii]
MVAIFGLLTLVTLLPVFAAAANADRDLIAVRGAGQLGQRSAIVRRACTGFNEIERFTTIGTTATVTRSSSRRGLTVRWPLWRDLSSINETIVGNPYDIVASTASFTTVESATLSLSYVLELSRGQTATASWTPVLSCISGTFTGCGTAGDQEGRISTPILIADGVAEGGHLPNDLAELIVHVDRIRSLRLTSQMKHL